jgi:hypothetical protein
VGVVVAGSYIGPDEFDHEDEPGPPVPFLVAVLLLLAVVLVVGWGAFELLNAALSYVAGWSR